MRIFKGGSRLLLRVCAFGAGLSLAGVFVIIFVNSLRRYSVGKSFEWGEELPIYLAIYGIMFGTALAYLQDRHIRFTILLDFFSERGRQIFFAASDLAVATVGAMLSYSGYLFVLRRGQVEAPGLIGRVRTLADTSGQLWIEGFGHMAFWQFAMILGGALLGVAALFKFAERLSALTSADA
jgi:TRAP-type C4-dicarboxylate transport system permease small subunit